MTIVHYEKKKRKKEFIYKEENVKLNIMNIFFIDKKLYLIISWINKNYNYIFKIYKNIFNIFSLILS